MGSSISVEQIERLVWIRSRVWFPHILLFLDRDCAGQDGARRVREKLYLHNLPVTVFDWDQRMPGNGQTSQIIPDSIQDPADMSVEQLRSLRDKGII